MGKWSQEQHSHPESSLTVTVQLHCIRRQKFTQESIAVTVPELQQYNSSTVTFPTFFFILTSPSIISDSISSPNYWFFFCFVFVYIALRKIKSFVLKTWRNLRPFGFTIKKAWPRTLWRCYVQNLYSLWSMSKAENRQEPFNERQKLFQEAY